MSKKGEKKTEEEKAEVEMKTLTLDKANVKVPHEIMDYPISNSAKLLYGLILTFPYETLKSHQEEMKVGPRAMQRFLKEFKDAGLKYKIYSVGGTDVPPPPPKSEMPSEAGQVKLMPTELKAALGPGATMEEGFIEKYTKQDVQLRRIVLRMLREGGKPTLSMFEAARAMIKQNSSGTEQDATAKGVTEGTLISRCCGAMPFIDPIRGRGWNCTECKNSCELIAAEKFIPRNDNVQPPKVTPAAAPDGPAAPPVGEFDGAKVKYRSPYDIQAKTIRDPKAIVRHTKDIALFTSQPPRIVRGERGDGKILDNVYFIRWLDQKKLIAEVYAGGGTAR